MTEKDEKSNEKKNRHFEVQSRRMLRSRLSRIMLVVGILLFVVFVVLFSVLPWNALHIVLLCTSPVCVLFAFLCDIILPRKITKRSKKDALVPDLTIMSDIYGNTAIPQLGLDALRAIREQGEPPENGEELAVAGYEENLRQTQQEEERRKQKFEADYQETKALFSELFQGCELKKEKMHPEKWSLHCIT